MSGMSSYNWHNSVAFNYETKRPISQALETSRTQIVLDLSRLRHTAPAKLRTCCKYGVGYHPNTTAGYAFYVIHHYLLADAAGMSAPANRAIWDQAAGIVRIDRPAGNVLAWLRLSDTRGSYIQARGREEITNFRRMFMELGGWSKELAEQALALTDARFQLTHYTPLGASGVLNRMHVEKLETDNV